MKRTPSLRRGSALIVVLGMLSFMVASAVGFAVYMRTSRQPSSYLRRSTVTRYLLKSALANAIQRLDGRFATADDIHIVSKSVDPDFDEDEDANVRHQRDQQDGERDMSGFMEGLCDDPYPGVGSRLKVKTNGNQSDEERKKAQASATEQNGGLFDHRVFTPFGAVDRSQTVATLTLEGLAYLPPAIINEVRVYSRRTRTACWRNLSYESGRYAFCAIDVSDLFDINRVEVAARTSAPDARIGFSSLFLKGQNWSDVDPSEGQSHPFEQIASKVASPVPYFVSLADFNLLARGTKFSPFCSYVSGGGKVPQIQKSDINDPLARNSLFITDTWFPPVKTKLDANGNERTVTTIDLAAVQPFEFSGGEDVGLKEILVECCDSSFTAPGVGENLIRHCLGGVGAICLYDYLDADSVPSSLSLPTVETAPMICGLTVKPVGAFHPSVTPGDAKTGVWKSGFVHKVGDKTVELENQITATPYYLDWGVDGLQVGGIAVFPFKRAAKNNYCTKYSVEAYVRAYVGSKEMNCRLSGVDTPIRSPDTAAEWKSGSPSLKNGVFSAAVDVSVDLDFKTDVLKQDSETDNLIKSFEGRCDDFESPRQLVYWRVEKKIYTKNDQEEPTTTWYNSLDGVFEGDGGVRFFGAEGSPSTWIETVRGDANHYAAELHAPEKNGGTWEEKDHPKAATSANSANWAFNDTTLGTRYTPHFALWACLKNDEGKVVDAVPATVRDDEILGGRSTGELPDEIVEACGGDHPAILDFRMQTEFTYRDDNDGFGKLKDAEVPLEWTTAYAAEPRYNYAPEAWFAVANGGDGQFAANGQDWLNRIKPALNADGRYGDPRDTDVFMFTSDQEYLQSMGELQFLPRLQNFTDASAKPMIMGSFSEDMKYNPSCQIKDSNLTDCLARLPGAWETYSYEVNGKSVYTLGLDVEIVSGQNSFKVNPFSQDRRVLMAAFANTPYDYTVASTNPACNVAQSEHPKTDWMLQHAFNSKTQVAKLTDRVLTDLEEEDEEETATTTSESELEDIVRNFKREMLAKVRDNWDGGAKTWPQWESVYDDLDWYDGATGDSQKSLFGAKLAEPLHGVDRKYLYSYWRECFQNRQQLFLVFLRAEPLSGGGGGREALSCTQLGVHGVALVWRDPRPPVKAVNNRTGATTYQGNEPPHRTRVLFFHQFD